MRCLMKESAEETDRPEYGVRLVRIMHCEPANFEHAEGDEAVVQTVACGSTIENQAFTIRDAKVIITRMLVALATYDDGFAQKLLDDHFRTDYQGNYLWPNEPYELW